MPADAPAHVIGVDPDRDSVTASVVGGLHHRRRWPRRRSRPAAAAMSSSSSGQTGTPRRSSGPGRSRERRIRGGPGRPPQRCRRAGRRVRPPALSGDPRRRQDRRPRRPPRRARGAGPARAVHPARPRPARGAASARHHPPVAQRARVAAICELKALLVTAPVDLRDQLRGLTTAAMVAKCSALRPPQSPDEELAATKQALRSIARRIKTLTEETDQLEAAIRPLISAAAPQLLDQPGVGPITAAQIYNRLVPPRAMPQRGRVRPPRRGRAPRSLLRADNTPPPKPPRRPQPQPGAAHPSPSPAADTAPTPRPTSPKESARAKPHEKPGAASNATSPASSTDSYSTHQPPLDKHRSIGMLRRWLPKSTDLNVGAVRLAVIEDHLNLMPRKLHNWNSAHSAYTALTCIDR